MGPSVELQLAEASASFLIGIASGFLYDLFRVLRRKLRRPALTHLSDVLFFTAVATALFSLGMATGFGQQRIMDTVIAILGGWAYFAVFSVVVLKIYTSVLDFLLKILNAALLPLKKIDNNLKKMKKFLKNIFHYNAKWYRIAHKYKIAVLSDDHQQNGGKSHEEKKKIKYPGNSPSFGTDYLCSSDSGIYVRKNQRSIRRKRRP